MRVLYLIDSLIAGGAERSLAVLAPHYVRRGVALDVAYLYERDNVWIPALEAAGAGVFSVAGSGGMPGAVRRTRKLIAARRPDLLHTTLFDADLVGRSAALFTRVPVVTSLVNESYGGEQLRNPNVRAWKLRAAQLADAATARRVTRFHAVSTNVATVSARRLHVRPDRIDVIRRGRDPEELGRRDATRRKSIRAALGAGDTDEVVLALGRHEYQKGFDVLIAAFEQLRRDRAGARLFIAGRDGSVSPQLRAAVQAAGLGDAVEFLGFRSDVPELFCGADLFVSASRWEGSPGSVIEAMALEAPIVATGIPAVREVLGDSDAAVLAPPDDATALALAMARALDDPESQ
ncbi:MAG TPA: glycosyltransferase, partial [Acidimicrobiia bacterium]|nr:glycosyltransferase [Acidimicrobiia bacterium]